MNSRDAWLLQKFAEMRVQRKAAAFSRKFKPRRKRPDSSRHPGLPGRLESKGGRIGARPNGFITGPVEEFIGMAAQAPQDTAGGPANITEFCASKVEAERTAAASEGAVRALDESASAYRRAGKEVERCSAR